MKLFDQNDLSPPPSKRRVAVNGVEIPSEEIAQEIQHHPASSPGEARIAATQALVVRSLMLQEAGRLGLEPAPAHRGDGPRETDEDSLVRLLLEKEVAVPDPTDVECRRFFERHEDQFRTPDIYEVSHILFSADREDEDAYEEARKRAVVLLAELQKDKSAFEDAARALSDCPSAEQGGNLGQLSSGQTVPEFEQALAEIPEGSIGGEPVETPYGVHIVRVHRRIAGTPMPFDQVRSQIADYLSDAVFHCAVHQYVALLAGRADIEGCDVKQATTPLVQ